MVDLSGVLLTGLLAGGASCAAVQGGLLAGVVAGRRADEAPIAPTNKSKGARRRAELQDASRRPDWLLDTVPVAGFLAGKLVSHTLMGALLGVIGSSLEFGFRARGFTQIAAGLVMLILAAHLLGVRAVRNVVPQVPSRISRWLRRGARSQLAIAPALLGLGTIFLPCGITISVEVLAVASGSPLSGALIMATFVVGTSPLFMVLGYVFRRSATALRGSMSRFAAMAVVLAGMFSINAGLVLEGVPWNLNAGWDAMLASFPTGGTVGSGSAAAPVAATVDQAGKQHIDIQAFDTAYSPSRVVAKASLPTVMTITTAGDHGCTRGIVFPDLNLERSLPETGTTTIDFGKLSAGTIRYTCSMGMYRGSIEVA